MTHPSNTKSGNLRSFLKDTVIFRQGEAAAEMFFVLKGTVQLTESVSGKELKITDINQGGFFGEFSLVEGMVRQATALAATDIILMSVTRENFNEVISKNPQLAMHIITVLISRLNELNPCTESSDSAETSIQDSDSANPTEPAKALNDHNPQPEVNSSANEVVETPISSDITSAGLEITPELYTKYCFEKEVACPVCGRKFKTDLVRESRLRLKERTDELRAIYSDIEPLYFNIWVCPDCYYSMRKPEFDKLTEIQKKNLSNQLDQRKKYVLDFDNRLSTGFAINAHKIAIDCCNSLGKKNIDDRIASLWLNIAWLYDDIEHTDAALEARQNALTKFKNAYTFGTDRTQDQDLKIEYLIGKLSCIIGNTKDAKDYFFKVVARRNGHQLLKQMARDGLDELKKLES